MTGSRHTKSVTVFLTRRCFRVLGYNHRQVHLQDPALLQVLIVSKLGEEEVPAAETGKLITTNLLQITRTSTVISTAFTPMLLDSGTYSNFTY